MADPERFLALLAALRQSLGVLARYRADVPRDRLLAEVDTQNMVLFALYRVVQGCIDLGHHLVAETGLPVPSTYREVFRVLGDAGIVDRALAERLEGWGGMRNVIAHHYGIIDMTRVATALYDELDDLEQYATALARHAPADAQG